MAGSVSPIGEYFQAWNERDADRRRELLERSVTEDVELVHPTFGRSRGIDALSEHIASYQQAMPGTEVVLTSGIDAHNEIARYTWQVVDASGET
jgi:SnoaL-like domain